MPKIVCKWPGLLVRGERVSPDEAAEIIVRTSRWPIWSNDKKAQNVYNALAGFVPKVPWQEERKVAEKFGALELSYLSNSRIQSSWVCGTFGWCSWEGNIGCSYYNIGKWPSVDEVTEDWAMIAKAFPFLSLTAQVLSEEIGCAEDPEPTAEWVLQKGEVIVRAPLQILIPSSMHVFGGEPPTEESSLEKVGIGLKRALERTGG